jgi:hypothetical protein
MKLCLGGSSWPRVKGCKVETPIHDSILRELITWECKEDGLNIIMNVLANPKGSVGRWNLNFWRLSRAILHNIFEARVL